MKMQLKSISNLLLMTTVLGTTSAVAGSHLTLAHSVNNGTHVQPHRDPGMSNQHQRSQFQIIRRNEVSPMRDATISKVAGAKVATVSCSLDTFAQASGQQLIDLVLQADVNCINTFTGDKATSKKVYSNANMLTLAKAAENLSKTYTAADTDPKLGNLFYVLRLAYYLNFIRPDEIAAPDAQVRAASGKALDTLVANSHFYTNSAVNGEAIRDAIVLMDVMKQQVKYLPQLKNWLNRWDKSHDSHLAIKATMNEVLTTIYGGFFNPAFVAAIDKDTALVDSLSKFIAQDWMLLSDAKLLQSNAALTLAWYLDPERQQMSVRGKAKTELASILSRYEMTGKGAEVWLAAADLLDQFGLCNEFNICNFRTALAQQILKHNHTCSDTLKMRAEDMTAAQFTASCNILETEESYFHQKLGTGRIPVAGDLNKDLEMAIFDNTDSYDLFGSAIFQVSLYNSGGMYLEGEPTEVNNQARFLAYEDAWARPDFSIWNLKHEYIHYLDGRYNMHGNFEDAKIDTHKTLWWVEGLAEYISHQDKYDEAIAEARTGKYKLTEIFANTYESGQQRVYRWGYLAVRFMFEKHKADVDKILVFLRSGQYDQYLAFVNSLTGYEAEWQGWLADVKSQTGSGDDTGDNGSGDGSGDNGSGDDSGDNGSGDGSGDNGSGDDSGDNGSGDGSGDNGSNDGDPNVYVDVTNGSYLTDLNLSQTGQSLKYYLDLPENVSELVVVIADGEGDADLYVRFDYEPGEVDFDCRPGLTGNNEVCRIENPQAGAWFIHLKAYQPYSGVSLQVAY